MPLHNLPNEIVHGGEVEGVVQHLNIFELAQFATALKSSSLPAYDQKYKSVVMRLNTILGSQNQIAFEDWAAASQSFSDRAPCTLTSVNVNLSVSSLRSTDPANLSQDQRKLRRIATTNWRNLALSQTAVPALTTITVFVDARRLDPAPDVDVNRATDTWKTFWPFHGLTVTAVVAVMDSWARLRPGLVVALRTLLSPNGFRILARPRNRVSRGPPSICLLARLLSPVHKWLLELYPQTLDPARFSPSDRYGQADMANDSEFELPYTRLSTIIHTIDETAVQVAPANSYPKYYATYAIHAIAARAPLLSAVQCSDRLPYGGDIVVPAPRYGCDLLDYVRLFSTRATSRPLRITSSAVFGVTDTTERATLYLETVLKQLTESQPLWQPHDHPHGLDISISAYLHNEYRPMLDWPQWQKGGTNTILLKAFQHHGTCGAALTVHFHADLLALAFIDVDVHRQTIWPLESEIAHTLHAVGGQIYYAPHAGLQEVLLDVRIAFASTVQRKRAQRLQAHQLHALRLATIALLDGISSEWHGVSRTTCLAPEPRQTARDIAWSHYAKERFRCQVQQPWYESTVRLLQQRFLNVQLVGQHRAHA